MENLSDDDGRRRTLDDYAAVSADDLAAVPSNGVTAHLADITGEEDADAIVQEALNDGLVLVDVPKYINDVTLRAALTWLQAHPRSDEIGIVRVGETRLVAFDPSLIESVESLGSVPEERVDAHTPSAVRSGDDTSDRSSAVAGVDETAVFDPDPTGVSEGAETAVFDPDPTGVSEGAETAVFDPAGNGGGAASTNDGDGTSTNDGDGTSTNDGDGTSTNDEYAALRGTDGASAGHTATMSFCPACGSGFDEYDRQPAFCPGCGQDLSEY